MSFVLTATTGKGDITRSWTNLATPAGSVVTVGRWWTSWQQRAQNSVLNTSTNTYHLNLALGINYPGTITDNTYRKPVTSEFFASFFYGIEDSARRVAKKKKNVAVGVFITQSVGEAHWENCDICLVQCEEWSDRDNLDRGLSALFSCQTQKERNRRES